MVIDSNIDEKMPRNRHDHSNVNNLEFLHILHMVLFLNRVVNSDEIINLPDLHLLYLNQVQQYHPIF